MLPVEQPFKAYTGLDGQPLSNGFVYFGVPNLDPINNPVPVFWDAAGTQPAYQPLRTMGGYIMNNGTPANVFCDTAYSCLVQNKSKIQVFYARNSEDFSLGKILSGLSNFAGSLGASLMGFLQAGIGAVKRTVQDELRERISLSQFGAVLDGVADDSAALQKAINYCATFSRWPALVVPGKCRIGASVKIDRLVDSTTGKFRIIGQGPGAGFYVSSGIAMFDSNLPTVADPQTERVRFENILFEAANTDLEAYVLSQKYLRMEFDNCEFQKIRMVNATIYLQDYWLTDCRIKDNGVSFMNCNGLYNVNFIGGSIKFGNTLVNNVSTAIGTNGLHFSGGFLAEGVKTQMVRANGATFSAIGCHFEANKLPMFNFFVGGPDNNSITFVGNYDYNPDHPTAGTLYYGATNSVFSSGNTCFPNVMHAHISSVLNFVSVGDAAPNLVDDPAQLTNTVGGVRTNGDAARLNRIITSNDVGIGGDVVDTVRAYIKGKGTTAATYACVIGNGNGQDIAQFKDDRSTKLFGAFSCNGATPQGPAVSGGNLSGVIAALVANGTLSS